ncbi:MAG TPA: class I SAM-dependent methyltransferase [Ktedonobacteraceae bacterium]|jgi:SAM-dependent methyltransferase
MQPNNTVPWLTTGKSEAIAQHVQYNYTLSALGGLLPASIPLTGTEHILDLDCGPASWAIDMLKAYPSAHITATGFNEEEMRQARLHAQWSKADTHITFLPLNVTQSLPFVDNTFDLVHAQPVHILYLTHWLPIVQEMARVLRPGGWLNIVVPELGVTSSDALNHLLLLVRHAFRLRLYQQGLLSEEPASRYDPGVGPFLYQFLVMAELVKVSYSIHALDLGADSKQGTYTYAETILMTFTQFKRLVCEMELVDEHTYNTLLRRARKDILHQPGSCGFFYLFSVSGCKAV